MTQLLDLPVELFHIIVLFLACSSDGAQNFARAMSVCKVFHSFKDDRMVHKALSFDTVSITNRVRTFYLRNILLFQCAQAGNLSAQHLLSKVLFVSSSHLFRRERLLRLNALRPPHLIQTAGPSDDDAFLAAWFVDRVKRAEAGRHHSELVRNFLRRCTPREIIEFGKHLRCHVRYFTEEETFHHTRLYHRVEGMVMFGRDIEARARVNMHETRRKIYEKYSALRKLQESRKKSRGESSSYSIADQLVKEIASLQTKMETLYELRLLCRCRGCGCYEKKPTVYFERCRVDALQAFEFVV